MRVWVFDPSEWRPEQNTGHGWFWFVRILPKIELFLRFISLMHSSSQLTKACCDRSWNGMSVFYVYWLAQFQHHSHSCRLGLGRCSDLTNSRGGSTRWQQLAPGFPTTGVYSESLRTNRAWGQATSKLLTTSFSAFLTVLLADIVHNDSPKQHALWMADSSISSCSLGDAHRTCHNPKEQCRWCAE